MISYSATLDVSTDLAVVVSRLLRGHRSTIGTRRGTRALTPWAQGVLVLRWFRDATRIAALARDAKIALATAYRYVHEGITVLAEQAPDLHHVITDAADAGYEHLLLDGTLIATDRVTDPGSAADRWYSGKHHHHGGNVQVIAGPDGWPLWTSPVEPGSTHDVTAARAHALPALYPAAVRGLPVLADKGYTGTGMGIRVPARRPRGRQVLNEATRSWNSYINTYRAPVERAIAVLKVRWRALKHVTLDPNRIGDITAAALVLTRTEKAY